MSSRTMVDTVTEPHWIALDGAENVRDVGGLPTTAGRLVKQHKLIRADNRQDLSTVDVRRLVDEIGVRAVADLRAETEVDATGPGPLTREPLVRIEHLSLLPAAGKRTDVATEADGPHRLPSSAPERRRQQLSPVSGRAAGFRSGLTPADGDDGRCNYRA